ncbi:MarR family winged helix-turn-helix transcriptional regulator [Sphingomonas sp. MMS24-JH45]
MGFYSDANFHPETSIGYLLRACHQHSVAALDRAIASEGISAVQWSALISIHFADGATCASLARDLAHDKGAMTRMIDTLEAEGAGRAQPRRCRSPRHQPVADRSRRQCDGDALPRTRDRLVERPARRLGRGRRPGHRIAQLTRLRRQTLEAPPCAA